MTKSPTREWVLDFIGQFAGQHNTITIVRPFIKMTGSIEAALLLSQIIYWSDRTTMDNGWFAKTYAEWEDELTLTKYQVMSAVKKLKDAGIETDLKKFNGAPTVHYRFDREKFTQWIVKFFDNPELKNSTNGSKKTKRSSTSTTQKTTASTPPRKKKSQSSEEIFREEWARFADIGNALLKAFGNDFVPAANQTMGALTAYLEVAKELTTANATVDQIPYLYRYIANRAKKEEWKTFGVRSLARYYTDFLKTRQDKIINVDPALDLSKPVEITPILMRKEETA